MVTNWSFLKLKEEFRCAYDIYQEKAMATHSSALAWQIPWMEEPGRLLSMGLLGVRHYWVTSLSLFTFMHWRRKWQPTPVFLLGESQGRGSLPSMESHRVKNDWSDLAVWHISDFHIYLTVLLFSLSHWLSLLYLIPQYSKEFFLLSLLT